MNANTVFPDASFPEDASIEPSQTKVDIYTLHLKSGLKVTRGQREVMLRTVRLRDITHADEQAAVASSERVVVVAGQPRLLVSDAAFKVMLTYQRIDAFIGADGTTLERTDFTPEIVGRLHPLEWLEIENRAFLVELAGQLRFGMISQAEFDRYMQGVMPQAAPQPVGQASPARGAVDQPVPGPAMLADLAAQGTPGAGDGVV